MKSAAAKAVAESAEESWAVADLECPEQARANREKRPAVKRTKETLFIEIVIIKFDPKSSEKKRENGFGGI